MEIVVEILFLGALAVALVIDIRAMILMYRSRHASEKQNERLVEQMKEIASL